MRYLREVLGVNIRGDAYTIKPNLPMAYVEPGDVLLFDYGKEDHAALIVQVATINNETKLVIRETNYKKCTPGVRYISPNDPDIKGVYRPLSTAL